MRRARKLVPSQQAWVLREQFLQEILRIVGTLAHLHQLLTAQQKDPATHRPIMVSTL